MSEDGTYKRQFKLLEKISDEPIPSYFGINAIYILTKTAIEDAVKNIRVLLSCHFFGM